MSATPTPPATPRSECSTTFDSGTILELIYDPNLEVNGFSKYKGVGFTPDVFVFYVSWPSLAMVFQLHAHPWACF